MRPTPPVTLAPMRFAVRWCGMSAPYMNCVTGPSALVGVVSVSPVTRAATTPMTTDSGTAMTPAHHGMPKNTLIMPMTMGPSTRYAAGNHQSGHSTSLTASLGAPVRFFTMRPSAVNERAMLRHWNVNASKLDESIMLAAGQSVYCTIVL